MPEFQFGHGFVVGVGVGVEPGGGVGVFVFVGLGVGVGVGVASDFFEPFRTRELELPVEFKILDFAFTPSPEDKKKIKKPAIQPSAGIEKVRFLRF